MGSLRMSSTLFDVVIIGGGPAGLSIATALARQAYTAVVLDSGVYRNARSKHMHNVPGFDHVDPAEFRAKAKADLVKRYKSIEFQTAEIKEVRKSDDGIFEVSDGKGTVWRGKKLGLGTGVRDRTEEEEVKGYDECWGRGMYVCFSSSFFFFFLLLLPSSSSTSSSSSFLPSFLPFFPITLLLFMLSSMADPIFPVASTACSAMALRSAAQRRPASSSTT
jgi:hypothetical protein